MKQTHAINLPTLMLVAATRGMLGAGIGMLVAGRLGDRRLRIGRTLVAIGALSTIPLVLHIFRREPSDEYVDVARFREGGEMYHLT
jgi:MFS family permease